MTSGTLPTLPRPLPVSCRLVAGPPPPVVNPPVDSVVALVPPLTVLPVAPDAGGRSPLLLLPLRPSPPLPVLLLLLVPVLVAVPALVPPVAPGSGILRPGCGSPLGSRPPPRGLGAQVVARVVEVIRLML